MEQKSWKLNGGYVPAEPKLLPAAIIEQIPNLQYWSTESLHNLYVGIIEVSIEMALQIRENKEPGYKKMGQFINQYTNKLKFIPTEHEKLIESLYNMVLAGEGLSTLPGFGLEDSMFANPEKNSIYRS